MKYSTLTHLELKWPLFALTCGMVIGGACNRQGWWLAALVALVGWCGAVLVTAARTALASAAVVASGAAGWHAVGTAWATGAVRSDDGWAPLWMAIVMGVLVGSQVLWCLALWLPMRRVVVLRGGSSWRFAMAWAVTLGAADTLRQLGWAGDGYAGFATALVDAPGVDGWLPLIGAQGIAFVAVMWASWVAWVVFTRIRRSAVSEKPWRQGALAALAIGSVSASGGALAGVEWTVPGDAALPVMAVQGNVDKRTPWSLTQRDVALATLEAAIVRLPPGGMVVTPETFLGDPPPRLAEGRWADLTELVDRRGVHLLLGMPQPARDEEGVHLLNAVVHLAPHRQSLYAKERLVPGFEYLPWPALLGPVYRQVFDGVRQGEMAAPAALTAPFIVAGAVVGVSICHEQAYALTMAERARDATLLVTLAEDGWIASPAYRAQMLAIARLRAMEFGKPVLRVSNGGSSVAIDARGRVEASAAPNTAQLLALDLLPRDGRTPYQQGAPWVATAPVVLWSAGFVGGLGRRRRANFVNARAA